MFPSLLLSICLLQICRTAQIATAPCSKAPKQVTSKPETIPEPSSTNPNVARSMMLASSSAAQIFKAQDLLRAEIAVDFSASKRPA